MIRMATGHTREFALRLAITRLGMPTGITSLTGIGWIDLDHLTAFIAQHLIQLPPTRSSYLAIETGLRLYVRTRSLCCSLCRTRHPRDIQVFQHDR